MLVSRHRSRCEPERPICPLGNGFVTGGRVRKSKGISARSAVAAVVVAGLLTFTASQAAFSAPTSSETNEFVAGTVVVTDNDSGAAMFSIVDMVPGIANRVESCVEVIYSGSIAPADVRLYIAPGDLTGGLAAYLDLVVERGTGASGFGNCSGFTSAESIYSGTLAGFAATHTDFTSGAGTWTPSATPTGRYHRFVVTLQADLAAQGGSATIALTWEAQDQ